ncbi:Trp biosynthesis-associated membrane protein [Nocardioides sp. C4-1]|uniref:Trp biosynthesis-associated membrane protein n=1 Tax=Nocardioides sp. C4-1 TaxID=3151851 RepID=UPI003263D7B3
MPEPSPEPSPEPVAKARSTFGPTVLTGLVTAGAAALLGNREWVSISGGGGGDAALASSLSVTGDLTAPPVTATALVLLASWGVVLVTRGRVRRGIAWLALVAALAVLGFAVGAWLLEPGRTADDLGGFDLDVGRTAWAHLGLVAGAASVAAAALGVRRVGSWPEMGRRYDAPAAGAPDPAAPAEELSSLDLWKAMDDGHDPTAGTERTDP